MKKILTAILLLIGLISFSQNRKLYAERLNTNGTKDSFFVDIFICKGMFSSEGTYIMPCIDSMASVGGFTFPQSTSRFFKCADGIFRNYVPLSESAGRVRWDSILNKPSAVTSLSGTNTGDNATNTQYSGLASSKENTIAAGTTSQYWRGDKTFQTLDKTAVGLSNVDNTSDATKNSASAYVTSKTLGAFNAAIDAQASDSYVVTLSPAPAAYTTGMIVIFRANTQNTTGCSINVNGLGVRSIVKRVSTTPATGDILAQMWCMLVYDGTNFVLLNPVVN